MTKTPDQLQRCARRLFARWQRAVQAAETAPSLASVCRRYGLPSKEVQRAREILLAPQGARRLWMRARRAAPRRLRSEVEAAVLQLARAQPGWGRKRLAKAMRRSGYPVCPMTVRRVLARCRPTEGERT